MQKLNFDKCRKNNMKIKCPFCGQHYEIEASNIDQEAQCASCGKDFTIMQEMVFDIEEQTYQPSAESTQHTTDMPTAQQPEVPMASVPSSHMKCLTCEMCGSTDLMKQDGVFVCQSCGTKYSVEEAKKMMISGTVNVAGTVKVDVSEKLNNLYQIAHRAKDENNDKLAAKYYDLILQEDSNSWEASFYSVYFTAYGCIIAEIWSAAAAVANTLKNVFKLVAEHISAPAKRLLSYTEICDRCLDIASMFASAANKHYYQDISSEIRGNFTQEYLNNISNTVQILYNVGDLLELASGQEKQYTKVLLRLAAKAWKKAVENHASYIKYCADTEGNCRTVNTYVNKIKLQEPHYKAPSISTGGMCYIATAVYGSYNCPQVWTLRRYRDDVLVSTFFGRLFIRTYYTISPTLIKWFGPAEWFQSFWKRHLDKWVQRLNSEGVSDQPYQDKN
jgi:DNA-directed RNA polymerase subunit M/transcription elongation factor TFIIS